MKKEIAVLYVEDNQDILLELKEVLEEQFYKVFTASDGKEALEQCRTHEIDMVITDIRMPVMDGIELARNLRHEIPKIPILVLTAHNDTEYLHESIKLGINGYVIKPIDFNELFHEIEKITEKIALEKELARSQQILHEYKNIIDETTIVTKANKLGFITYANDAFCKLTGYKKEELVGANHNIIRHPDTKISLFEDMWDTILNKKVWKGIVKNRKKDGSHYWVDVYIKPILDKQGEIVEFMSIRKDITVEMDQKRHLENLVKEQVERLRKQDEMIFHQSKFAAMGEMVDAIAHQWKQPLHIIKLNIEFLAMLFKDGDLDEKQMREFEEKLYTQINHMDDTLNRFREFLRPNMEQKSFDVNKCIENVETLLKDELMAYGISLEKTIHYPLILRGRENEFIHVIINIINNAKDAMVENSIENRKIHIQVYEDYLTIQDNGGGISSAIIGNIFDANFTTKPRGKGTGIGLYMSKQIIEKMGAKITANNQNGGACFTISFS